MGISSRCGYNLPNFLQFKRPRLMSEDIKETKNQIISLLRDFPETIVIVFYKKNEGFSEFLNVETEILLNDNKVYISIVEPIYEFEWLELQSVLKEARSHCEIASIYQKTMQKKLDAALNLIAEQKIVIQNLIKY